MTFIVGSLLLCYSCSNDELLSENNRSELENGSEIEVVNINSYLTNRARTLNTFSNEESNQYALKFRDEITYKKTIAKLEAMSDVERTEWFKTLDGFESLQAIFDRAMEDVDNVDETEESYMNFKAKYDKYLYFPMYEEDYGFYMPVIEQEVATIANPNGLIVIGNEVVNIKNISTYSELQLSGQAYYPSESNIASRNAVDNQIYTLRNRYIGREQDSGWEKRGKRKLKLKFGLQGNGKLAPNPFTLKLHLEVSFRKKTWVGWVNYSSKTTTTGTINIGGVQTPINFYKSGSSSHDWYSNSVTNWWRDGSSANGIAYYRVATINANLSTSFQGFSNPKYCNFALPSVRFTNN